MADYAAKMVFSASDGVSGVFDTMGRGADRFAERTSSAFRNATKEGYKFGTIVKGILAANIIRGGIDRVQEGFTHVASSFIDFDDEMVGAVVRFKDIGAGASNFNGKLYELSKGIREIGVRTGTPFTELAKGYNELAISQFDSKSAMGSMLPLVKLNLDAQGEFGETTKSVVDIMGAWNFVTADAAQNITNLTNVVDRLARAKVLGRASIQDIAETMKQMGPIGRSAGYSFEEMLSMTVLLGRAGIRGHEATTAFKNGILNIADATRRAELQANGIAVADKNGNLRKFPEILKDIHEKTKNLGSAKIVAISEKLFGKRGYAGNLDIMRQLGDYGKIQEQISKSKGFSNEIADKILEDTKHRIMQLKNAATDLGFKILDAFKENGKSGIENLIEIIKNADVSPVVNDLKMMGTAISGVAAAVGPLVPYIPAMVKLWMTFKAYTIGREVFVMARGFYALIKPFQILAGLSTYMELLGMALATISTPLLVIAGVAAPLIALFSALNGTDNIISKAAQWMGVVPQLATDKNGVVTGYVGGKPGFAGRSLGDIDENDYNNMAPNYVSEEAKNLREKSLHRLEISGQPSGSKLTTVTSAPSVQVDMLGANPNTGSGPRR
jgi:TP901 family phage tail tape measure protein